MVNRIQEAIERKHVRILSIDGGGIHGVIPAAVCFELEKEMGRPLNECFDIIAGTSTGGIIAVSLGLGIPTHQILDMYVLKGHRIFGPGTRRFLGYVWGPKYSNKGLLEVLEEEIGDARLSDVKTEILVPFYDIRRNCISFFRSWRARESAGHDFYIRDVVLATSAAPTFLPPVTIRSVNHEWDADAVDGGVGANNPAACAVAAVDSFHTRNNGVKYTVVSLGTGDGNQPMNIRKVQNYGILRTAPKVINMLMDAPCDAVHYQMTARFSGEKRYFRINPKVTKDVGSMDRADPAHVRRLLDTAVEIVSGNKLPLTVAMERLMQ